MELAVFQQRVAQRLGVLPVSGSLSPEDGALILAGYQGLLAELMEHGLAWWNEDEALPDAHADSLIGMTAASVVDDFTIAEPRRSQLIMQHGFGLPVASVSERRLRALTRIGPSSTSEVEYF
jgi:hypothetical protein